MYLIAVWWVIQAAHLCVAGAGYKLVEQTLLKNAQLLSAPTAPFLSTITTFVNEKWFTIMHINQQRLCFCAEQLMEHWERYQQFIVLKFHVFIFIMVVIGPEISAVGCKDPQLLCWIGYVFPIFLVPALKAVAELTTTFGSWDPVIWKTLGPGWKSGVNE